MKPKRRAGLNRSEESEAETGTPQELKARRGDGDKGRRGEDVALLPEPTHKRMHGNGRRTVGPKAEAARSPDRRKTRAAK
jgi:hypothetical protein